MLPAHAHRPVDELSDEADETIDRLQSQARDFECCPVGTMKELETTKDDVAGLSQIIDRIEALLPQNFLMDDDASINVRVFIEAQREAIRRESHRAQSAESERDRLRGLLRRTLTQLSLFEFDTADCDCDTCNAMRDARAALEGK